MARPSLKAVEAIDPAPEAELRGLFRAEAELEGDLRLVRACIGDSRRAYAAKHGLLVMPNLDTLRRLFS